MMDMYIVPVFLIALALHVAAYYLHSLPKYRLAAKLRSMDLQIVTLRQEAKDLFSPSNFSKSALKERKANTLEKKKEQIRKEMEPDPKYLRGINVAKVGIGAVLFAASVYAPIASVPDRLVAPSVSRVNFPWGYTEAEGQQGGWCLVSMLGWVFLVDRLASDLVAAYDATVKL